MDVFVLGIEDSATSINESRKQLYFCIRVHGFSDSIEFEILLDDNSLKTCQLALLSLYLDIEDIS